MKHNTLALVAKTDLLKSLAAFLFIALLVFLAMYGLQPGKAVPANAPLTEFSSGRAMKHIEAIAQQPHPPGSLEHDRVRQYILSEFAALGLDMEVQKVSPLYARFLRWYTVADTADAQNILARLPGTDNTGAILIAGHYDSVVSSPNASDGGSSVGLALEMARLLQASPPLKNDVIFLLTDAEEHGLLGARGFVEQHPWVQDIGLVLHFIARGSSGPSIMFETSPGNSWLIEEFAQAAPRPIANSLTYQIYQLLTNDTDFTHYKKAGLAGFNFGYIDNPAHYHTMLDNPEQLDERSLQHHGSYALALTRHFGNLDLGHTNDGNAIYFDILGLTLVHYPGTWAMPLMLLVALFYVGVIVFGLKEKWLTLSGIGLGVLGLLLTVLVAFVVTALLGRVILALHSQYNLMLLGNLYNGHFYLVGFVSLTIAIATALYIRLHKKIQLPNLVAGGLFIWLLLTVLTSLFLPGASYLFLWPLLFSLLALGIAFFLQKQQANSPSLPWLHLAAFSLGSAPGLILFVPTTHLVYTTLPPLDGTWIASWVTAGSLVVSVLVALLSATLVPSLILITKPKTWLLPAAAAIVGLGFLLAGSLTSGFNVERPRPNSILYGLNADTGQAVWISRDEQLDEWTAQFFPDGTKWAESTDWVYLGMESGFFLGPAPAISVPIPEVVLLDDNISAGVRSLRLDISLPQPARSLVMHVSVEPDTLLGVKLDDAEIDIEPEEKEILIRKWAYSPSAEKRVELVVETTSSRPVKVVVFGGFDGLPQSPEVSFSPRPAYMIPAPLFVAGEGQEATLVRKAFEFPVSTGHH